MMVVWEVVGCELVVFVCYMLVEFLKFRNIGKCGVFLLLFGKNLYFMRWLMSLLCWWFYRFWCWLVVKFVLMENLMFLNGLLMVCMMRVFMVFMFRRFFLLWLCFVRLRVFVLVLLVLCISFFMWSSLVLLFLKCFSFSRFCVFRVLWLNL